MKLSKSEQEVLDILGDDEMTLEEIADVFYKRREYVGSFMGSNKIGNHLRRIRAKCEYDKKVKWTIDSVVYDGRTKIFWVGEK